MSTDRTHSTGRTLAIDYGEKRIGLALSDELGIIATGLGSIPNDKEALHAIVRIIAERDVQCVIIGLPLTLRGERGSAVLMVERFADALRPLLLVPLELIDERFTSSMAQQAIRDMGMGKKKRRDKSKIDEISAVILLQGYLDSRK
jgi:putative holliday junction resolvase